MGGHRLGVVEDRVLGRWDNRQHRPDTEGVDHALRPHGRTAGLQALEAIGDPSLNPAAVEELLRFDSPTQADFRRVLADCEVNGFALRKRDNVVLPLGAASRDPDIFEDPDRLDVGRSQGSHLSFGRGIHHCLGSARP